jgi:uncharacterized protein
VGLPAAAAWRHVDARVGFEVLFPREVAGGYLLEGHSVAVEDGEAWSVRYTIELDATWTARAARVVTRSRTGGHELRLDADGAGAWRVDGADAAQLEGCVDVDLEASVCTNTLPVHRLSLNVGERADVPAAYVRVPDNRVERLEQSYARLPGTDEQLRFDYESPAFDYRAVLEYDEHGFILDYPGIATRVT